MLAKKSFLEDTEIANQRLELTDKGTIYFLGPNLTVRNCSLVLKVSARDLLINGARFIDCTFDVKQELKNHQQWICAALKGCRFKGRLLGCDFGHWPEYPGGEGVKLGAIEHCDFSEARMDACRFVGCDMRTIQLPRWPCFTFMDPRRHVSRLLKGSWPELFGNVIVKGLQKGPEATAAVTFHAPSVAKLMETTPDALRAVIEQFDCIVY